MRRIFSAGTVVPLLLAVAGAALIIAGQLDWGGAPATSLPPITLPSRSAVALATPSPTTAATASTSPTPSPTPSFGATGTAVQLQISSIGLNVKVFPGTPQSDSFPPLDGAYINSHSSQPGRGTNTYIIAHARQEPIPLFKNLWNVQLGAEVLIEMSDGQVLRYRVTEVRPNASCPDPDADPMPVDAMPLALRYATDDCAKAASWSQPTDHERLTLQTSQGYNRNWGELVIVADPVEG